jgi:signal transduction histidine kinase
MIPATLNLPLFIIVASYTFSFVLTTLFGLWVYLKSSRKMSHVMFLLLCLAIGVYQVVHIFGITSVDALASASILQMTAVALTFVVCFTVHWIAAAIEREREYASAIIATYVVGAALAIFYVIFPSGYLLDSVPKLYFPNYYVAGSYFWLFVLFFAAGFGLVMRMLLRAHLVADSMHRNRIAYYIAAILLCYPLGAVSFFLAFGIEIDPILSVPFNFFIAPLAYGILRYDIMDIRLAARRALSYAAFILGTALFILAQNIGSDILAAIYPSLPSWLFPLGSALVIVLFAGYLWERVRDLESLKYEFITVVTHKFRTPLTRIKWSSEIVKRHSGLDEDVKQAMGEIDSANEHLASLTDMLLNLRKASESAFQYEFAQSDVCATVGSAAKNASKRVKEKSVEFSLVCPETPVYASLDKRRMLFALQIVIENAVAYTPKAGKVEVAVASDEGSVYIKVKDTGIGIAKDDASKLFTKFWRSKEAKTADTEGMGIGLYMAKEIVDRHDGEIYAESEGVGKGSTFTIQLPLSGRE